MSNDATSGDLAAKVCVPCRGGVPPLGREEVESYLGAVPDWRLSEDASRVARDISFGNFAEALDFVNRVGALAEGEGHHPDIAFGWGYARITLYTHKIKGLHENDFIMAAKIDALMAG